MQIDAALRASLLAALALAGAACSGTRDTAPGTIAKVKYFHLQPGKDYFAADPAIPFEAKYHLHGAVTSEERSERYGHYYTIDWKAADTTRPVTLRFEFRQKLTGPAVQVIEVPVNEVDRSNRTRFQVTGDAYFTNGPVTSWRVTLLQDGQAIASDQSFLWD